MPLSQKLTASFRDWSASFLAPFRLQVNKDEPPFWADIVRERTLALLYDAMHENGNIGTSTHPLDHVHNWGLASRALECVDRQEHGRLSVHHICKELGCTTRALQYAFQTTLDLTPLQYVLTRRLHLARRELLSVSSGPSSVTKAAANQGFQNFGRFSHYYQVLFGELPSDTLRRREVVMFRRNGKL
ncbi:helix-turn-helix domain-containing protein [Rhizobiaceae bacterium n13]|uniref:Helix-turn-helix domain-containing protein n=1 Tax=Ferirhizobium litorale TaxID=2927786 RepID=A0AAE3U4Q6_9HYPH|nr:helix-turn-helix domain-containing protein [Fererhizobium litorale]MDI7864999.1 helix-turn-helix domain-containing protein [Fererhizobium litorale]MDI7925152.1 helix-turn-helix domain-containing protein [Fererhizobium litorale]